MDLLFYVFFGFLGASVGSFSGVLIDRLPRGEDVFKSRSHCDNCRKKLSFIELIPVFSFIFLRGKCKNCKKKIPPRLFFIELIGAGLYIFAYFLYSQGYIGIAEFILLLIVLPVFLVIFFSDLIYGIIPDQMLIVATVAQSLYLLITNQDIIINHTLSAIAAGGLFYTLYLLTRGKGMGFGDVKFALVLGFFLGFPAIITGLYGAFLTGAVVSIILVLWGKKKLRGSSVPFGPFLVVSGIVSYFWGEKILHFFLPLY